jgi:hypothetical protein
MGLEEGLGEILKKDDVEREGELELNVWLCTLGDVVLTIWIGWMILMLPGVEEMVMGSTWKIPFSIGVTVKDLGETVGEDFTEDKPWNDVVAGVVS